jgi:hypothetical protein
MDREESLPAAIPTSVIFDASLQCMHRCSPIFNHGRYPVLARNLPTSS